MKQSVYNYHVPFGDSVIFLNGLTEASFQVPGELYPYYQALMEGPDGQPEEFAPFIEKLRKDGFIVDNDADERAAVGAKYDAMRCPDEFHVMILPTYQCNLRCWYCVQDHAAEWLDADMCRRVRSLIERGVNQPGIRRLQISWFGGEPLLAYDQVLELTRFAQSLARRNEQEFICSITTNATLLTPARIDALRQTGVTSYQITIDGKQDVHDSVKKLSGASAFDTALRNIAYICRDTPCNLRFNYTPENLEPEAIVADLASRLPEEIRRNIDFNIQPVWQNKPGAVDFSDVMRLMELTAGIGIRPSLKPGGFCYVDKAHFTCVYPSCTAGKCDNGVEGVRKARINADGTLDETDVETSHYKPAYEVPDSECSQCRYLPFCWGPCTQKRYLQLRDTGRVACPWGERKEAQIAEQIINRHLTQKYVSRFSKPL